MLVSVRRSKAPKFRSRKFFRSCERWGTRGMEEREREIKGVRPYHTTAREQRATEAELIVCLLAVELEEEGAVAGKGKLGSPHPKVFALIMVFGNYLFRLSPIILDGANRGPALDRTAEISA